ncbi:MAG: acyl carrier protein [Flavobacterium sp.]
MEKTELLDKLKTILKPYTNNDEAFNAMTEDSDFINDLKVNSANLVDIILDIEEAFDITINNTEMERMMDVRSAVEIIESKVS